MKFFLGLGLSICLLLTPSLVQADIILTEMYPAPSSDQKEWIEIYNTGPEEVILESWYLTDILSSPSLLFVFTNEIIAQKEHLIIELPTNKLNNGEDGVRLYNNQDQLIDQAEYKNSQTNKSWQRVDFYGEIWQLLTPSPGYYTTADKYPANSPQPSPSPTLQPSLTPTPTPSPSPNTQAQATAQLKLTEVHYCPDSGTAEWLELYNPTNQHITFFGVVQDASNNTKDISGTIEPSSYTVFSWEGSLLNNSGDTVEIITNQHLIADISLPECVSGSSYSLVNDNWLFQTPSPGKLNPQPSPSPTPQSKSDASAGLASGSAATQDNNNSKIPSNLVTNHTITPLNLPATSAQEIYFPDDIPTSLTQEPTTTAVTDSQKLKIICISVIIGSLILIIQNGYLCYEIINQET